MSLIGNNTEERIWNFLKGKGLNDFGVAGLMGNLNAESCLRPNNVEDSYQKKLGYTDESYTAAVDNGSYTNFVNDCAGYGLAQWTYHTRKAALLAFVRACNASIGDLEAQLNFLWKELSEGYKSTLATLKSASSVREASDKVLTQFERPADMSEAVKVRRAGYGQTYYDKYANRTGSSDTTEKEETEMSTKITTGAQLAARCKDLALNYKTLYVMGCFGAPMTSANKKRYCSNHEYNKAADRTAMIQAASADTFGFDCVCMIKGLLWGWKGDKAKTYGGASYASNGVPDIGADSMIKVCSDISTDFSKIEVGEAVWVEGHIGIYIGDGLAVECTPKWGNKVQITACNCNRTGYNRRNWTKHGKLPYVSYTGESCTVTEDQKPVVDQPTTGAVLNVGDIVTFTGTTHYSSANAATGPSCKPGKAKVTAVYKPGVSKHPYHLIAESGGGSTVYGWVDIADIAEASVSGPVEDWTPKKGDTVIYNGNVHYASAEATRGPACKPGMAKITDIYRLGQSKHPYHLVRVTGGGSTVYGWVDAGSFTKA